MTFWNFGARTIFEALMRRITGRRYGTDLHCAMRLLNGKQQGICSTFIDLREFDMQINAQFIVCSISGIYPSPKEALYAACCFVILGADYMLIVLASEGEFHRYLSAAEGGTIEVVTLQTCTN